MRILKLALIITLIAVSYSLAGAQELFTNDNLPYSLELPSASWRAISEPDAAHEHLEFVNGDRLDGFLQIRKEMVDSGTTTAGARPAPCHWRDGRRHCVDGATSRAEAGDGGTGAGLDRVDGSESLAERATRRCCAERSAHALRGCRADRHRDAVRLVAAGDAAKVVDVQWTNTAAKDFNGKLVYLDQPLRSGYVGKQYCVLKTG